MKAEAEWSTKEEEEVEEEEEPSCCFLFGDLGAATGELLILWGEGRGGGGGGGITARAPSPPAEAKGEGAAALWSAARDRAPSSPPSTRPRGAASAEEEAGPATATNWPPPTAVNPGSCGTGRWSLVVPEPEEGGEAVAVPGVMTPWRRGEGESTTPVWESAMAEAEARADLLDFSSFARTLQPPARRPSTGHTCLECAPRQAGQSERSRTLEEEDMEVTPAGETPAGGGNLKGGSPPSPFRRSAVAVAPPSLADPGAKVPTRPTLWARSRTSFQTVSDLASIPASRRFPPSS